MSVKLLSDYDQMISEKVVQFVDEFNNSKESSESPFNLNFFRYGTFESIHEELSEVIQAVSDDIHSYDHLIEELGDVIFNVCLLASKLGIDLETILSSNLEKVARRG